MHKTQDNDESTIYHYTTHAAAFSILGEQKFRVSNLHHLNDAGEFLWILDHLQQYISDREKKNEPVLKSVATELIKFIEKKADMHTSICVACFSTCKDDAAQWDRYAKNGRGVCLAFNVQKLQNIINGKHGEAKAVKYFDTNDKSSTYNEIDNAIRLLESHAAQGNFLSRTMQDPVPKTATFIKDNSFNSEKEFRLALYGCGYFSYKFTFREDAIIPYIELPITLDCISEIILGPSASPKSIGAWDLYLAKIHRGGPSSINITRSNSKLRT